MNVSSRFDVSGFGVVVTGGAKGVDQVAMLEALECGGAVVGVLAGNLERAVGASVQGFLDDGDGSRASVSGYLTRDG